MWFDSTTGDHYKYPVSYYLEKLKNKVQRYQNFILPTIVEENFLNFQEVEEIKNKVIDLKYLWTYLDPVNGMDQSIPVRFLSQGMYSTIIKKYFLTYRFFYK